MSENYSVTISSGEVSNVTVSTETIAVTVGNTGPATEMQQSGLYLQYRAVGATTWTNLITLASITGPAGTNGTNGAAATITVGSVTTGAAGSSVVITNAGTTSAAIFNFTIPKGDTGAAGENGAAGAAATIAAGTTTTLSPGASATVSNSGSSSAAVFNFGIPAGAKGDKGDAGTNGTNGMTVTVLTQAAYDLLSPPDPDTLYIIIG